MTKSKIKYILELSSKDIVRLPTILNSKIAEIVDRIIRPRKTYEKQMHQDPFVINKYFRVIFLRFTNFRDFNLQFYIT